MDIDLYNHYLFVSKNVWQIMTSLILESYFKEVPTFRSRDHVKKNIVKQVQRTKCPQMNRKGHLGNDLKYTCHVGC